MTRYQKSILLIGALILVALVAIIAVLLTRPPVVTPMSATQQVETADFLTREWFLEPQGATLTLNAQATAAQVQLTVTALLESVSATLTAQAGG